MGSSWSSPSQDEEQILALEAEIKKNMKKKRQEQQTHAQGISKRVRAEQQGKHWQVEKPRGFYKPPKDNEMKKPKYWEDKPWCYCCKANGGKYASNLRVHLRVHKPSECEGKVHPSKRIASLAPKESPSRLASSSSERGWRLVI